MKTISLRTSLFHSAAPSGIWLAGDPTELDLGNTGTVFGLQAGSLPRSMFAT